jgi:D-hexose-6-phosphate mutarotase
LLLLEELELLELLDDRDELELELLLLEELELELLDEELAELSTVTTNVSTNIVLGNPGADKSGRLT